MKRLYVTTDALEAKTLIEGADLEPKFKYYNFDSQHGEHLVKILGFNPMCSVELDENISARELDVLATKLVKEGLLVTTETDERVQKYVPCDITFRNTLVKISLYEIKEKRIFENPSGAILRYSNNPNTIQTFYNSYY
ncbi:MAG: hypothetical protein ACMXYF_04625 [Candidatus Woesearchaeota archaeon]